MVAERFIIVDVPDTDTFIGRMRDPLARFIYVVTPLAEIYSLPMTSLHIFYDMAGGLIAFNRNGSIFLNLRYFEAWRECPPLFWALLVTAALR